MTDLRKRTKEFAGRIIRLYVTLPPNRREVQVVGHQMLRSGTSVGANYREASRARSDAEFVSKIELCIQEADETLYWLELLCDECGIHDDRVAWLEKEANELISIFVTMSKKVKGKKG
ncbi:MAG: four helix bundle protein [bacterium]